MKSFLRVFQRPEKIQIFVFLGIITCFIPFISAPIALGLGLGGAFFIKSTGKFNFHLLSNTFLKVSIVLMGFGMNWNETMQSSSSGLIITTFSVLFTLLLGILIGKLLKVDPKTTLLIAVGTAICGGSAIAAVSPVINAKNQQLTFALIVVFILNAIGLILFPIIGNLLDLSQEVFGYWAAIAIHDTTSVVGAGEAYGDPALQIATTVKLTRALWIIPLVIGLSLFKAQQSIKKLKFPYFILFFLLAMFIAHQFPQWESGFEKLNWIGRRGMVIALFFIGSNMRLSEVKNAGLKTLALGVTLWVIISTASLYVLTNLY